jgi:hypothetical protein
MERLLNIVICLVGDAYLAFIAASVAIGVDTRGVRLNPLWSYIGRLNPRAPEGGRSAIAAQVGRNMIYLSLSRHGNNSRR